MSLKKIEKHKTAHDNAQMSKILEAADACGCYTHEMKFDPHPTTASCVNPTTTTTVSMRSLLTTIGGTPLPVLALCVLDDLSFNSENLVRCFGNVVAGVESSHTLRKNLLVTRYKT